MQKLLFLGVASLMMGSSSWAGGEFIVRGQSFGYCQSLAAGQAELDALDKAQLQCGDFYEATLVEPFQSVSIGATSCYTVNSEDAATAQGVGVFQCDFVKDCMSKCMDEGGDFLGCHTSCGGW